MLWYVLLSSIRLPLPTSLDAPIVIARQTRNSLANARSQEIIPEMKAEVLSTCNIVFSSLIPVDTPPQEHENWRLALQFGASCHTRVGRGVTHVVAAKVCVLVCAHEIDQMLMRGQRGTEKVKQAHARGITVVNPAWFFESIASWERKDESLYPLEGSPAPPPAPPPPSSSTLAPPPPSSDGVPTRPPSPNGKETREGDAVSDAGSGTGDGDGAGGGGAEGDEEDMWAEMDREVEEAMGEDDDDDDEDGDDEEEGMDEVGSAPPR